jgi:alkanesulfonate monooxygenase SsuD/methylene tetrahydromethanopterin reductase-like flavin-dependent oxidoreductase (luciferase family)
MDFGIQFFPTVGPEQVNARQYFADCLQIAELADNLGYSHLRAVEHYFEPYGGYSPNPFVFLAAMAMRSNQARLIVGAVLPAFNHPLKIAGEIGMLDAISDGRAEIGFGRAFLPHEFKRFGIDLDSSKARFSEGLEQVRLLLEQPEVASHGQYHSFDETSSLPRPTQQPRPPFWIAATSSPDSFINAGKAGHAVMTTPLGGGNMRELLDLYRDAWRSAGHQGKPKVMLAFHMFCWPDSKEARELVREPLQCYLQSFAHAASDWTSTASSNYSGYDQIVAGIKRQTPDSMAESGSLLVGSPAEIREQIEKVREAVGGFEVASLQVSFGKLPVQLICVSLRRFAAEVMPLMKE